MRLCLNMIKRDNKPKNNFVIKQNRVVKHNPIKKFMDLIHKPKTHRDVKNNYSRKRKHKNVSDF